MIDWVFILADQLAEASFPYWVAVLLGMCQAFLARVNHIWLFPCGIVAMSLALFNLLGSGQYAEVVICAYFVVMYTYGWLYWSVRNVKGSFQVSYAQGTDWRTTSFMTVGGFVILYVVAELTGSIFPIWEAAIGATMCAGVWLLNNRKIEHWVLLNVSQGLAIPLLFYSGQVLNGVLALFLYIFAINGFFTWRRIIHQQRDFSHS